ncbi:hypothetical protein WJR50_31185 [Catalinimonas sp. 4WD22]|uniref:hypothetical protein n=1 Tax=Catalinimonas locisalis TaxID=3133978 RepID=UPI0031017C0D
MKVVDLSKPIKYNKSDPWFMKVKIKHKPHRRGGGFSTKDSWSLGGIYLGSSPLGLTSRVFIITFDKENINGNEK